MVEELQMAEGFQQTDAGIIPNDWVVKPLHEVAHFENGKAHEQFIDEHGDYIVVNSKFISTEGRVKKFSKKNIFPLKKGDITIVMSDIPKGKALAKCFLIDKGDAYTLNQRIGGITANDDTDNKYLFYKLNRNKYYLAFDSGTGQTNIKRKEIIDCPVALPSSRTEQVAISHALNNVDLLIESIETLLVKKRNLKQGVLQKLLKPKDGWQEKQLDDLGKCIIGLTYSPLNVANEGTLVLRSSNIQNEQLTYDDNVFVQMKIPQKVITQKNDILICVRNGSKRLIGKCCLIKGRAVGEAFGAFMSIYRSEYNEFLVHVFQSNIIKKQIEEHIGATINQITNKNLNSFIVPFPDKTERERISLILSNMNDEIEKFENQLSKYKKLKIGMEQELLFGKKRLI